MANLKKPTSKPTPSHKVVREKTPEIRKDETTTFRWFMTGLAIGMVIFYFINGGFDYHSAMATVTVVTIYGMAVGMWMAWFINW